MKENKLTSEEMHFENRNHNMGRYFKSMYCRDIGSNGNTNGYQSSLDDVLAIKYIMTSCCYKLICTLLTTFLY